MPELETLFVRIEADLSEFKAGLRRAEGDTRAFATNARTIIGGVGSALDMSPFREELAQSERAGIQAAERMDRRFADFTRAFLRTVAI